MTDEKENNKFMWSDLDQLMHKDLHGMEIDPEHSDYINFIRSQYPKVKQKIIPSMLKGSDLTTNTTKAEKYKTPYGQTEKWKECKILGKLLDT